jgi:molybdopterin/thiamine biosynthesis adenylyltransferase
LHKKEISDELKAARRSLESIQGYSLVEDLYWDQEESRWFFCFSMEVEHPGNDLVGRKTYWRAGIDENYPKGEIDIYPDAGLGIVHTFQHQNYNTGLKDRKYRAGKICLDSALGSWGRKKYTNEPRTAKDRLYWHIWRCQQWIYAALLGRLFEKGDPFELPAIPNRDGVSIIFNEDGDKLVSWKSIGRNYGDFEYFSIDQLKAKAKGKYIISSFTNGKNTIRNLWGVGFNDLANIENKGFWILLDSMPILIPWRLPENFGELTKLCSDQGLDFIRLISNAFVKRRARGQSLELICLGFPVPQMVGEPAASIHWFAIGIPKPRERRNGFRPGSNEYWKFQLREITSSKKKIDWLTSENWHKDQITNRGKMDKKLQNAKILLVGAGSVGSTLIELFARLGCEKITIVDHDQLQAGNLSRHSLTLNEVGNNKAEMLSWKLNSIFPHMDVQFEPTTIQSVLQIKKEFLSDFDIIIEATAQDEVLEFLQTILDKPEQLFVSVSASYKANRLYGYLCRIADGSVKIIDDFAKRIAPYIAIDKSIPKDELEMIEGIGCWHPIFPSRIDDIQMLLGAMFKKIEEAYGSLEGTKMVIVEKTFDEHNNFKGLNIIDEG